MLARLKFIDSQVNVFLKRSGTMKGWRRCLCRFVSFSSHDDRGIFRWCRFIKEPVSLVISKVEGASVMPYTYDGFCFLYNASLDLNINPCFSSPGFVRSCKLYRFGSTLSPFSLWLCSKICLRLSDWLAVATRCIKLIYSTTWWLILCFCKPISCPVLNLKFHM